MDFPALYGSCGFAASGRKVLSLVCLLKGLAGGNFYLLLLDLFFRRGVSAECAFQAGHHVAGFRRQLSTLRGPLGACA